MFVFILYLFIKYLLWICCVDNFNSIQDECEEYNMVQNRFWVGYSNMEGIYI